MTALEQLIQSLMRMGKFGDATSIIFDKTFSLENAIIELNKKYSVTLRNSDSTAGNNKVEQSISDEELMSKIEDMAIDLATNFSYCSERERNKKVKEFGLNIRELFKNCLNPVFRALNDSDEQSIIK